MGKIQKMGQNYHWEWQNPELGQHKQQLCTARQCVEIYDLFETKVHCALPK